MASVTDICNYALSIIGSATGDSRYLETFDGNPSDTSSLDTMKWCQLLYPRARDYALIQLAPPECIAYADCGTYLDDEDCVTAPGWEYFYQKPTDALCILGVLIDALDSYATEMFVPHQEVQDQIACNYSSDVQFKYVKRLEDTAKFSEGLIMAVAHRLAYLLAKPLGVSEEVRQSLLIQFKDALAEARMLNGQRKYRKAPELTVENAHYRKTTGSVVLREVDGSLRVVSY